MVVVHVRLFSHFLTFRVNPLVGRVYPPIPVILTISFIVIQWTFMSNVVTVLAYHKQNWDLICAGLQTCQPCIMTHHVISELLGLN